MIRAVQYCKMASESIMIWHASPIAVMNVLSIFDDGTLGDIRYHDLHDLIKKCGMHHRRGYRDGGTTFPLRDMLQGQIVRQDLPVDVDAKRGQRHAVTSDNHQLFTEPVFGVFQHSGDWWHGETQFLRSPLETLFLRDRHKRGHSL